MTADANSPNAPTMEIYRKDDKFVLGLLGTITRQMRTHSHHNRFSLSANIRYTKKS